MSATIRTIVFTVFAAGLVLALGLGLAAQDKPMGKSASSQPAGAETFQVDPVHSTNVFKIRHNGLVNFYGRFDQMSGSVVWDSAKPEASTIQAEIKTDSIDTNNEGRNKHLKSAEFFDVEKFPSLTFKSTAVKKAGEHMYDVTGDLTLHGVTKLITVKFDQGGVKNTTMPPGRRSGLETTFTIKRSDYGMTTFLEGGMLGDEVTMTVSLECAVPQKREG